MPTKRKPKTDPHPKWMQDLRHVERTWPDDEEGFNKAGNRHFALFSKICRTRARTLDGALAQLRTLRRQDFVPVHLELTPMEQRRLRLLMNVIATLEAMRKVVRS